MGFFEDQNSKFYDFLNHEFELKKCRTWEDVSSKITHSKIKETYKYFAKLFPLGVNYLEELEKYKSEFSSIHYATLKGHRIIDEVVRFSLYSDKIIVFHPLQNPAITDQKMDPRQNGKLWLPDFIDALFFYIIIQKWVKAGIVELIINPYEYDFRLRDEIDLKVRQRLLNINFEDLQRIESEGALRNIAEQLAKDFKNDPKEKTVSNLLKMSNPRFTEKEADDFADRIIEYRPLINPIWESINKKRLYNKNGTITPTKGGGPLESLLLLSEVTGGKIYTPSETNWYQIKQMGLNDFWLKTNHLYSKIPLPFLNSVDTDFALNLRKDDRLSGVRQELHKIYSELEIIDISILNEDRIRFLQEGFIEELKKAESEWKLIKKEAEVARKKWLTAHIAAPIVSNEFSVLPMAVSALWFTWNELSKRNKLNEFRARNPVSVYVDLKNQKQHFWTELKNCLI